MRTYKILCIALFAVLLSVLYFIESKYGEMSMFNGTPPFEFGDTGRRFVDVLETPILFAWFGGCEEMAADGSRKLGIRGSMVGGDSGLDRFSRHRDGQISLHYKRFWGSGRCR